MFKNILFQTHWFLGITAGLVLALMGATGALYSFQAEITRTVSPQLLEVDVAQNRVMPMGRLVQQLHDASGGRTVRQLRIEFDDRLPSTATTVDTNGENRIRRTFDPVSGQWMAEIPVRAKLTGFFTLMLDLHRFLAMGGTGRFITGACTLMLLVSCVTGLYLRWPRKALDWRAWLSMDWARKGRSFQWDLHAVAGTWSLPLLLFLALTGLWWSYDWYRDGLTRLLGDPQEVTALAPSPVPPGEVSSIDHDRAWAALLTAAGPGVRTAIITWPIKPGEMILGSYRLRDAPHDSAYNQLQLDPATSEVLLHDRYVDKALGSKLLASMYALHVGEYFGLTGRILVTVVSLLMPLFLVTGLWLYLDRRGKRRQARRARRALLGAGGGANTGEGWLIGFASQSGTAEQLAWRTAGQLQAAGHQVTVQPLGRLQEAELSQARQALFIVSTFGEGEPPDSARGFDRKMPTLGPDLSGLRYAVLALGDRQYKKFCDFARRVDGWLADRGARALFAPVEVDNGDAQALEDWQRQLGALTGIEAASQPEVTPFAPWRLVARRCINPGSEGAPVCLVSLVPLSPQDWQAGDALEVQVPTTLDSARATVSRDYSIASLPADGRLELIVRQAVREDGGLGLGSGWLTAGVPELGEVQARVRCNRNFHAPDDDRPMILVGNGTGIAGLRGLLKARIAAGHRRNWLLFGERNMRCDFFCGDEIDAWHAQGWLARVDLAFSRDQARKVYVQDRLRAAEAELRAWVTQGASVYVCGSLEGMAGGVDAVLRDVLGEDAVLALVDEGRYRRDVY